MTILEKMTYLNHFLGESIGSHVQKLLEVLVEELENKRELLVSMQNIDQSNNVGMLQLLQKSNLSDGRTWNTFVLRFKSDCFQSIDFTCVDVLGFVDHTVSTLTDLLKLFVLVNLRFQHISFGEY